MALYNFYHIVNQIVGPNGFSRNFLKHLNEINESIFFSKYVRFFFQKKKTSTVLCTKTPHVLLATKWRVTKNDMRENH